MVDLRLEFVQYNDGVIQAGAISQTSISVPIPNGLFGDFYVFLETDKFDLNGDVNRANNIAILQDESFNEKKIHIKLSDFADLIGQSFIAPSLIESGTWCGRNI